MSKKLIFLPYACDPRKNTGVNLDNRAGAFDTYCKNFCVAAVTLKHENPSCDVALVTNTTIPQPYGDLLSRNGVLTFQVPYDTFLFPEDYTWSLAFYKLCALAAMVARGDYDYYCYLDTDVVANGPMDYVWQECDGHILLLDVNHGLGARDYTTFLQEVADFTGTQSYITHYGGEFFAASRENAREFVTACQEIYREMISKGFVTTRGDEFILALAAQKLGSRIKNAGAYIYRFWTGSFRLVSTCYRFDPVAVLHLPGEKERGMLRLFHGYIARNRYPTRKQIWRACHLTRPRLKTQIRNLIKGDPHR